MVVCDDRMLEYCSISSCDAIEFGGKFLDISEENIGAGRKGGPPGGPSSPKAGIGSQGRRGGIGFAVPRQVARGLLSLWEKERPKASQLLSQLARMEMLPVLDQKVRMISGKCLDFEKVGLLDPCMPVWYFLEIRFVLGLDAS